MLDMDMDEGLSELEDVESYPLFLTKLSLDGSLSLASTCTSPRLQPATPSFNESVEFGTVDDGEEGSIRGLTHAQSGEQARMLRCNSL